MKFKFLETQKSYLSIHSYRGIDFLLIPSCPKVIKMKNSEYKYIAVVVHWLFLIFRIEIHH